MGLRRRTFMKTPLACIVHFITISRKWILFLPFFLISACLGGSAETEQIGSDIVSVMEATRTPIVIRVPRPAFMSTITPTVAPATPTNTAPATSAKPVPPTNLAVSGSQSPAVFQTSELYRGIRPVTYVEDTCEYLRDKWDPAKSAPGTFVAPIMYHAISPTNRTRASTWTPSSYFYRTINEAKRLGFETVTAAEVASFLEHNARIPERSLMLILDDRRLGSAEDYMLPTARRNGWTYTMAWNISDTDNRPGLWERVEGWHETGLVDAQSHGLRHRYMTTRTPEKKIRSELFGPIPIHDEHFGYRPTAFIWLGGCLLKKPWKSPAKRTIGLPSPSIPAGPSCIIGSLKAKRNGISAIRL